MKSTAPLRLLCAPGLEDNRVVIHPNDGADLGLMMSTYPVQLEEGSIGELHLRNECPEESVEINMRFWERLGKPKKAILRYDGAMLRIERL